MSIALLLLISVIIFFGPQVWAGHVFRRYSQKIDALPGTGGELAEHLLDKFELDGFKVEKSEQQADHYDPEQKSVRLADNIHNGKSLTAIVVSAHEVGHALQHKTGYRPFFIRWHLARIISNTEKLASILLVMWVVAPVGWMSA